MSLQKGKILDLRMDRGFKDSTPYENHGTATDVTLGADRKGRTKAGVFNGTSSYVDCGNDSSLRLTNTATISAWIKYSGNIGKGNYSGVIGSTEKNHYNWLFRVTRERKIELRAWNGTADNVTSNSAIALNTWTLITAAIDISSGYVEIYINGTLDIRDTNFTFTSLYNNEPNTLTKIGVYNWTYDDYFDGLIERPQIWNRALSSDEVKLLYESYNPCLMIVKGGIG